jgi:hypothetical protein
MEAASAGGVLYGTDGPLVYAGYSHCSQYRKFSGSEPLAFGGLTASDLSIVLGADLLGGYDKSPATRMRFCMRCGSNLFTEKLLTNMIHLRLGTLDTETSVWPQLHVHVDSMPQWSLICDGLPRVGSNPTQQEADEFQRKARALIAAGRPAD